jgi:uncharacterized protein (UPF0332 family)
MADNSNEISENLQRAQTSINAAKEDIDTSKHSGVIASIHRLFVKEGKLDKEQGKNLQWLFDLRGVGDYGVSEHVSAGEAYKSVKVAEEFLEAALQILDE